MMDIEKSSLRKDPLRVTISDPIKEVTATINDRNGEHFDGIGHTWNYVSPRDRRARWIYQNSTRRSLRSNRKISDSGFSGDHSHHHHFLHDNEQSGDYHKTHSDSETGQDSHDSPFNSHSRWEFSTGGGRLGCSLPPLDYDEDVEAEGQEDLGTLDSRASQRKLSNFLSRQGGVRHSLTGRRPISPSSSISSESQASQEGCENALNPSSVLLLPTSAELGIRSGRKQSVLFSSYNDAWSEGAMAQRFREMSPPLGAVLEAAWGGDTKLLQELFENDGEVGRKLEQGILRDGAGRTPLHLAAACGHFDAVQLLLEKGGGVGVNEYDSQKSTPLSCASSCGSVPVVELLLSHGADVNAGYDFGKTALQWSVQAGSASCAKLLLEAGALQNPPKIFSETPLHVAAALGNTECLQLLLDYGADPSLCKGTNRSTALHLAAEEGNAPCLKMLLKSGASHEAKDLRGHTALHISATCDADCVLTLLKGGANPNAQDGNGRTPLHCSVSRGSRAAECVRLLVGNGAEIDAQDTFGYTPLHLAAVNETSQCASILLSHGADVTAKTKAGTTALALLVRKIPDVMRYLVDRLDSAVTIHDHDPADPDCEIRLDFKGIVPHVDKKGTLDRGKEQSYYDKPRKETEFLTCVLAAGNKKILAHPLSEAFLTLKWQRVRKFFWASLLFQIALVALFTTWVIQVYLIQCPNHRGNIPYADPPRFRSSLKVPILNSIASAPDLNYSSANNEGIFSPFPPEDFTILPSDDNSSTSPTKIGGGENLWRKVRAANKGFSWFNVRPRRKFKKNDTTPENGGKETRMRGGRINNRPELQGFNVHGEGDTEESRSDIDNPVDDMDKRIAEPCVLDLQMTIVWGLLVALASVMGMKEIFQLLQAPMSYVLSSENWGQWALIASVVITAWDTPDYNKHYWQYPAAALGIFLAWGLMLLQVGRFPALGLYVQMLGKVAANFGLFIMAYACLLIAFALAFCVLFPEHPPYSSVPLAILKVLTMMVGEVDYEELFYAEGTEDDPVLYAITAHFLHGAFVIIVTIVLMNLLVGLAVHDIQGLQKGAKLNRLSRQTALISRLESFIFSKRLQSCLPRSLGSILQKSALLVPSSYNWSYYFRPNDPRDLRLPKDLKQAALRLAASKHSSRTIRGHPDPPFMRKENGVAGGSSRLNLNKNVGCGNSVNGPTRASGAGGSGGSNIDIRRVEQRLDNLQLQVETLHKNLNDKLEIILLSCQPKPPPPIPHEIN